MELWLIILGSLLIAGGMGWSVRNIDSNTAVGIMVFGMVLIFVGTAFAHDHKRPELNGWFRSLKSPGGGYCCDGSDGMRLDDVDWESKDGKYRVRIEGKWVDVPPDSVITDPNLAGTAMVWPTTGYMGLSIR
jgi:hypothetical protein